MPDDPAPKKRPPRRSAPSVTQNRLQKQIMWAVYCAFLLSFAGLAALALFDPDPQRLYRTKFADVCDLIC